MHNSTQHVDMIKQNNDLIYEIPGRNKFQRGNLMNYNSKVSLTKIQNDIKLKIGKEKQSDIKFQKIKEKLKSSQHIITSAKEKSSLEFNFKDKLSPKFENL